MVAAGVGGDTWDSTPDQRTDGIYLTTKQPTGVEEHLVDIRNYENLFLACY